MQIHTIDLILIVESHGFKWAPKETPNSLRQGCKESSLEMEKRKTPRRKFSLLTRSSIISLHSADHLSECQISKEVGYLKGYSA